MQKTNFDASSTGLNITVCACYDTDLSRMYFEECFTFLDDQLVYGDLKNFQPEYNFTKKELLLAWSKVESKDDFLVNFRSRMGFALHKATKQDLIDYCETETGGGCDWLNFCEKAGFKPNFDTVVSRGYCQGDYKEIIVPHEYWEAMGIPKPECVQSYLGGTIDNLLWDSPIYCRFTVNKDEFYIDPELSHVYEWDKSEALGIASKLIEKDYTTEQQSVIMQFLVNTLPNELDYQ